MLTVQINENEVRELCKERIADLLKEVDADMVFWDTSELKRRTCMSWNHIQNTFFFDPRMPKFKVGRDWRFPARETREFLEKWLQEQRR